MTRRSIGLSLILCALVALAVGLALWRQQVVPAEPAVTKADVAVAPAPQAAAVSAPAAAASAIEPTSDDPAPAAQDIADVLADLVGRQALSFFQLDEFPHRFVATVDNLGRSHAPSRLWPVNPTAGRFIVFEHDGRTFVSPDNGLRYTPLVLFAETVNIEGAVDVYARLLPLLQQAYEDLGFPQRRFHARLLEVIDQLLATPDAPEPLELQLTRINGPFPSARPWAHFGYADPALEAATAGQKILLRVGPVNARRLKARLAEIRKELARRVAPR